MKLLILFALVGVQLASAFPAGDVPFLNIKISRPDTGSFGTSVSKQKVELEEDGKVVYEPYHPHVPPFLAFKQNPTGSYAAAPPPPPPAAKVYVPELREEPVQDLGPAEEA